MRSSPSALAALLAAVVFTVASASAADKNDKTAPDEVKMNERARKATAKALEWLASKQNTDGSWSDGRYPHNTAITAFALLAFMSQGHLPNQGQYGPEVAKGGRFLLASARERRLSRRHARRQHVLPRHGHARPRRAVGHDRRRGHQAGAEKSGRAHRRQSEPRGRLALRAAADRRRHFRDDHAGDGPAGRQEQRPARPRRDDEEGHRVHQALLQPRIGGFSLSARRPPGFARTAAGVCVLQLTGEYKAKEIPEAIDYHEDSNFDERVPLLVRPLLRRPRHAPGRRQGVGGLVRPHLRHASCPADRRRQLDSRAIAARSARCTRPPSPSSSCRCR